ncbi:enoyl reductase [Phakopsora pachyrhizi]|nr:enoyl reductase [Phakopsora pachyrhizi]
MAVDIDLVPKKSSSNNKAREASRNNNKVLKFQLEDSSIDKVRLIDLKNFIKRSLNIDLNRQRLSDQNGKVLVDDDDENSKTLDKFDLKDHDIVYFKDLGPQISWRTVFLVEYFGPLWIHPMLFTSNPISNLIYGGPVVHNRVQKIAFGMVMVHFMKRELESIYVHRFSNATMPFRNIFKNSFHYWILSGVLLALPIYGQKTLGGSNFGFFNSTLWITFCCGLWTFAELSNLKVHLYLKSLRPPGTKIRKLPKGYGFGYVCCPNYLFESIAWFSFGLINKFNWSSLLFWSISTLQMSLWALKKKKNYLKEFKDSEKDRIPKGWKAIVPFIL